jgi:hypothetical protein
MLTRLYLLAVVTVFDEYLLDVANDAVEKGAKAGHAAVNSGLQHDAMLTWFSKAKAASAS